MTRTPDDIFAAQFWAWPDPALKRDAHGRVLFVNAAFLQLFGGSVESWRGQVVQGWSAPQPGPVPSRFEIRTPAYEGMPEQVFDWMEMCGADGSGFAIARNVTAFLSAPVATPEPQPVHEAAPTTSAQPAYEAPQVPAANPPAFDPLSMTHQSAPSVEQPIAQPEASYAEPDIVPAPPLAAPQSPAPVAEAPMTPPADEIVVAPPLASSPAADASALEVAAPQVAQSQPTAAPTATVHEMNPHAAADNRDFERRALPIENDEAVLGNNWRDAVIAKAVGAEEDTPPPMLAAESSAEAPKADAIRILLAEDNAINALLTRTLLEADGHSVETVEDGLLAVEAMKTQSFDMIFMDMRMPNMDGLEATRKIRSLPNVPKDLPIVALTANAFDDDRNACFDSGMNDFMTKPVSAEELSEMVIRWTSQAAQEQRLAS